MSRERSKFPSTKSVRRFFDRLRGEYPKVDPICSHFGRCGGCYMQDISYEDQLRMKLSFLRELFGDRFELEGIVIPSPQPLYYRHRMDFVCAFGKIGLRRRGNYAEVIDLDECHLISPHAFDLLRFIKRRVRELGIEDYDFLEHQGFLRYVVLREAKFTDELMVIFTSASPPDVRQREKLVRLLEETLDRSESVYWLKHEGLSDHSYGEPILNLGASHITEKVGPYRFMIKPDVFFQSNPLLVWKAYEDIREWVYGRVLDLYCGIGTISVYISDVCDHVTGVEIADFSVQAAEENAKLNGIENVRFYASDVGEYLKKDVRFDVIVVDPPRPGLSRKIIKRIKRISPDRIVYMSCNPITQFEDLKRLCDEYELERPIRAYDMFPQTYHIETLAILKRRPRGKRRRRNRNG
ncbi:TPA: 23S rRNA (uracil(1939)-C(5))-methyltransferase RlmD [Candidatus Poribacteria bacterium]|nr:23S rRNA (uracil(1939)-C(5))-methyltransferase RlmD [Candidatus Poribacteria bacterium]HEX29135.1 23S rRNA (uracil(1939)-C(5))-methyltransferase RlmD [Candidatus Poribacteria bacterium]